jgi:hypothetical protein
MLKKTILFMSIACSVVNGSTLDFGMIGHYTFEGNANDIGSSGNNLQIYGSSQFISTGHNGGQALKTNGDRSVYYNGGGYLKVGFLQNLGISSSTFSFWTRNEQSGGAFAPGHTEEAYLEIGYGDAPPYIQIGTRALGASGSVGIGHQLSNGVWQGNSSSVVNWADWKMITLTVTSTEYVAFLNGVEFDRKTLDAPLFPSSHIQLGSHTWNGGGGMSARMDVEWDDLRIYDRALTSAEVTTLYATESVPEPSALSLLAVGSGGLAMMRRRRL